MNIIECKNIQKTYTSISRQNVKAVNDISLCIQSGDMCAVTGKSGSGKSTLLNVLSGLMSPDHGEVFVCGKNIHGLSNKEKQLFRNKKIGFVFQNFMLEKALSSWENVALPLIASNVGKKEREKRAVEALEMVGLSDRVNHRVSEMSGGEQQRIAIARAIINKPEIVFADEPTGNLDNDNSANIMKILKTINATGATIVLVTHDEQDVSCCKRRIRLSDGKVIEDESL